MNFIGRRPEVGFGSMERMKIKNFQVLYLPSALFHAKILIERTGQMVSLAKVILRSRHCEGQMVYGRLILEHVKWRFDSSPLFSRLL